MDVSQDLADYAAKHANNVLERAVPIEVDAGLLAAFDNTPVDADAYKSDLDPHLLALTLTSTASLLASIWALPRVLSSTDGPTATLPPPITLLPREKPLPKPKQPTKWERFAKAKGISHKTREKREWDEERQEWVNRWGRDGKNREKEEQWLHEVKAGDDADHDPAATARADRKARVAKNLKQQAANQNRAINSASGLHQPKSASGSSSSASAKSIAAGKAAARSARKTELERTLLISKSATASMGKFDNKIEGEPRAKGVKRKFEANELGGGVGASRAGAVGKKGREEEKERQMNVLKRVERGEGKKVRKGGEGREGDINARKAVRYEAKQERARKRK